MRTYKLHKKNTKTNNTKTNNTTKTTKTRKTEEGEDGERETQRGEYRRREDDGGIAVFEGICVDYIGKSVTERRTHAIQSEKRITV